MLHIELTDVKRTGEEQLGDFDIAGYSKKTFGMFAGEESELVVRFENKFIGVVMDRFGKDCIVRKEDDKHFSARIMVSISAQFYGWLSGLGSGVKIISPAEEAEKYTSYLRNVLSEYEG
jgi:predicted DNA-binding transcriptional regulator YafY